MRIKSIRCQHRDSGPNTLRDACKHKAAARWIVFAVSGTICLSSPIRVPSFTTVDGRGHRVRCCFRADGLVTASSPQVGTSLHGCPLSSPIRVPSFTTIDGRGQRGAGLQLRGSQHVILCCFLLTGGRGHDADAIQMKPQVAHVWVDRCTLSDYDDGLIDITRGSTDVTISR
ncbi:unnamed protein product [Closterium sp. NIES-53]